MATIIFPTDTEDVIDAIRGAIGRDTYWYTIDAQVECPTCGLDSGIGYIITYTSTAISGHISWGYSEQLGWVTGGQLDEGECRVQIKYTPANYLVVENAQWVVVDGKTMQIVKKILRGVQNINRILVDLIEKEKE
jgi:hypothetical protein